MHAQKFGCQMREDFFDINLLLVARFLTKNSLFNILLILKSKKLGEYDRYFVQYLSSPLVRVDGTRSGKWLTKTGFGDGMPLFSGKHIFK